MYLSAPVPVPAVPAVPAPPVPVPASAVLVPASAVPVVPVPASAACALYAIVSAGLAPVDLDLLTLPRLDMSLVAWYSLSLLWKHIYWLGVLKPEFVACRPPTFGTISTLGLFSFLIPQLLLDSFEPMLTTYVILSCLRTVKLLLTPVTSPLGLSAHVIFHIGIAMNFHITNLAYEPRNYLCTTFCMIIDFMLDQHFPAFTCYSTCVALFCEGLVHCIHMVDEGNLIVGYLRAFWAFMLIFLMNVFIMFVYNCV